MQIDENPQSAPLAFRTCRQQGCVVPVELSESSVQGMRAGTALKVEATSDNGQVVTFSLSLKGFSKGFDRVIELQK